MGGLAFDRWRDDDDGYLYLRAFLHFDPRQMIDLPTQGQMLPSTRDTGDKRLGDGMRVGAETEVMFEGRWWWGSQGEGEGETG